MNNNNHLFDKDLSIFEKPIEPLEENPYYTSNQVQQLLNITNNRLRQLVLKGVLTPVEDTQNLYGKVKRFFKSDVQPLLDNYLKFKDHINLADLGKEFDLTSTQLLRYIERHDLKVFSLENSHLGAAKRYLVDGETAQRLRFLIQRQKEHEARMKLLSTTYNRTYNVALFQLFYAPVLGGSATARIEVHNDEWGFLIEKPTEKEKGLTFIPYREAVSNYGFFSDYDVNIERPCLVTREIPLTFKFDRYNDDDMTVLDLLYQIVGVQNIQFTDLEGSYLYVQVSKDVVTFPKKLRSQFDLPHWHKCLIAGDVVFDEVELFLISPLHRTNISLEKANYDNIYRDAKNRGVTMNYLINQIIQDYYENKGGL